ASRSKRLAIVRCKLDWSSQRTRCRSRCCWIRCSCRQSSATAPPRRNDSPRAGWIQGYVRRAGTGEAVSGALVSDGVSTARSDSDGYFRRSRGDIVMGEATPLASRPQPEQLTLTVDAPGFTPWQRSGLSRLRGLQTMLVALGDCVPDVAHVELGARDRVFGNGVGSDDATWIADDVVRAKATLLAPPLQPP